jgi:hypothetical protein
MATPAAFSRMTLSALVLLNVTMYWKLRAVLGGEAEVATLGPRCLSLDSCRQQALDVQGMSPLFMLAISKD